jgi:hypothetical protein
MAPQTQAASAAQQNAMIRALLKRAAVERVLPLPAVNLSAAQAAGTAPVVIVPQPVGFLKKFIIEITGTANNTDGANAANLSDIGLANLIGQVAFQDTQSTSVRRRPAGISISSSAPSIAGVQRRRFFPPPSMNPETSETTSAW